MRRLALQLTFLGLRLRASGLEPVLLQAQLVEKCFALKRREVRGFWHIRTGLYSRKCEDNSLRFSQTATDLTSWEHVYLPFVEGNFHPLHCEKKKKCICKMFEHKPTVHQGVCLWQQPQYVSTKRGQLNEHQLSFKTRLACRFHFLTFSSVRPGWRDVHPLVLCHPSAPTGLCITMGMLAQSQSSGIPACWPATAPH